MSGRAGQLLFGGDASQGHVWPFVIVCPHPASCMFLHLSNRLEQIMPQPVVTHRAVVAFDVGVLLWISWLDILQANAVLFRPEHKLAADVLWAVVTTDGLWFTAPLDDLIQCAHHSLRRQ